METEWCRVYVHVCMHVCVLLHMYVCKSLNCEMLLVEISSVMLIRHNNQYGGLRLQGDSPFAAVLGIFSQY